MGRVHGSPPAATEWRNRWRASGREDRSSRGRPDRCAASASIVWRSSLAWARMPATREAMNTALPSGARESDLTEDRGHRPVDVHRHRASQRGASGWPRSRGGGDVVAGDADLLGDGEEAIEPRIPTLVLAVAEPRDPASICPAASDQFVGRPAEGIGVVRCGRRDRGRRRSPPSPARRRRRGSRRTSTTPPPRQRGAWRRRRSPCGPRGPTAVRPRGRCSPPSRRRSAGRRPGRAAPRCRADGRRTGTAPCRSARRGRSRERMMRVGVGRREHSSSTVARKDYIEFAERDVNAASLLDKSTRPISLSHGHG